MMRRFARPLRRLLDMLVPVLIVAVILFAIARSWSINHVPKDQLAAEAAVMQTEDLSAIVSFSCENGTETLSFHLDESGTWRWIDETFPLNSEAVAAFAEELKNFTPTEQVASGENLDLDSYELSTPEHTLRYTTAGGETTTLQFGKTLEDGGTYFKYANNDAAIYVAPVALTTMVHQRLYDLCLTDTFPALNFDTVSKLTLTQGEKSVTYSRRTNDDGSFRWFCGSKDVTENATFLALMEELSTLSYDACLVWNPVADSLTTCGLDEPQLAAALEYTDANQRECDLTLFIGNERSDTQYFAAWSAKSAIYSIRKDAVDGLFAAVPNN